MKRLGFASYAAAVGGLMFILGFVILPITNVADPTVFVGYRRVIFIPAQHGETLVGLVFNLRGQLTTVHRLPLFLFAVLALGCTVIGAFAIVTRRVPWPALWFGIAAWACAMDGAIMFGEGARVLHQSVPDIAATVNGRGPWIAAVGLLVVTLAAGAWGAIKDFRVIGAGLAGGVLVIALGAVVGSLGPDLAPAGPAAPPQAVITTPLV